MSAVCSPDSFQAKMSQLMATLEFVQTYLDNLLCISKGSLDDHLSKFLRVFILLWNVNQCTQILLLCHGNRIPRVYTIQRCYQTKTKKVQAILTLILPQNFKQLCRFLGMVQYYRDIWARHSEMLAPLSNLVGECGHTKVTKANKTTNSHGIGRMSISKHSAL